MPRRVTSLADESWQVQDELMKRGFEGGVEAAHSLRGHVVEFLGQKPVNITRDLGIVIYVYADVQELAARYLSPRLPEAAELVREFCQGFNSAHPWSCYDNMNMSSRKRYLLRGE